MNAYISDLFFNLDHKDHTIRDEQGRFVEYDRTALLTEATWFAQAIAAIGGPLLSQESIVDDFLKRDFLKRA